MYMCLYVHVHVCMYVYMCLYVHVYTLGVLMSTLPPVPCLPSARDCSVLLSSSSSERGQKMLIRTLHTHIHSETPHNTLYMYTVTSHTHVCTHTMCNCSHESNCSLRQQNIQIYNHTFMCCSMDHTVVTS